VLFRSADLRLSLNGAANHSHKSAALTTVTFCVF
jgi:hypothetical protein